MKLKIIAATALILTIIHSSYSDEYRIFTDKEGRDIHAKIISVNSNGQKITVQREGQRNKITVPVSVFDDDTQQYIYTWVQNADFLNNRIFSVEPRKKKEKIEDQSTSYSWGIGANAGNSSTISEFYGHHVELVIQNKSKHAFNEVSLEYTLFYEQEKPDPNKSKAIAKYGTLYQKQTLDFSVGSKQEIVTEQVILQSYSYNSTDGNGTPDLDGEFDGAIIHLTLTTKTGETITREIIYPDKLKQTWTTETTDVQPSFHRQKK